MRQFEDKAIVWGSPRPEVRVILLAGSRARTNHPADEWSDLDLEIYVTEFNDYLARGQFIPTFGKPWITLTAQTTDGDPQFLVVFDGGYKVDFTFIPIQVMDEQIEMQRLSESQVRGYKVLIDKDRLAARLPMPQNLIQRRTEPKLTEFMRVIDGFWYGAIVVAKQLRRQNLWVVKAADWRLKADLFTMIEWHAQSQQFWRNETWYGGNFIKEWVDAETWRALHKVFGHFQSADSWQALLGSMDLFRRVATETADHLTYPYPQDLDTQVSAYINQLFEGANR